jgi:hypothetical protein
LKAIFKNIPNTSSSHCFRRRSLELYSVPSRLLASLAQSNPKGPNTLLSSSATTVVSKCDGAVAERVALSCDEPNAPLMIPMQQITPLPACKSSNRDTSPSQSEERFHSEADFQPVVRDEQRLNFVEVNNPPSDRPCIERMLQVRTLCIVALSVSIFVTSIVVVFHPKHTFSPLLRIDSIRDSTSIPATLNCASILKNITSFGSAFVSTPATTSSSMGVPVLFTLRFVPSAAAVTRDYVSSDSTPRIFSPGRMILRPNSIFLDSFHHDACILSQAAREVIQHSIRSNIIAQDSPQCLRTCCVSLPSPQLQCPGALLVFQLPNSMLLPAGASIFAFDGVNSINGSGLEFIWEAGTGSVVSLDAVFSNVTVMQVALYKR